LLSLLIVLTLSLCWIKAAVGDPAEPPEISVGVDEDVEFAKEYQYRFLSIVKRGKRWRRVPELSETIVSIARKHGVPLEPVLVIIGCESSFKQGAIGTIGGVKERGLMQVHPQNVRGWRNPEGGFYSKKTSEGQLNAGCQYLRHAYDTCKTEAQAIGYYRGSGCKVDGSAKYRMRLITKERQRRGMLPIS
jgi:hypothetical protein